MPRARKHAIVDKRGLGAGKRRTSGTSDKREKHACFPRLYVFQRL